MSILNRPGRIPSSPPPYLKPFGVRFNSADSSYAGQTFALGDRRKFSMHFRMKRATLGATAQTIHSTDYTASSAFSILRYGNVALEDILSLYFDGVVNTYGVQATNVFRDPTADLDVLVVVDTAQAVAADRVKMYVPGQQLTVTALSGYSVPPQNYDTFFNTANLNAIGRFEFADNAYLNAVFLEYHYLDGIAADPSDFWTLQNGLYVPKAYTGAYNAGAGVNGFHLDFWPAKYGEAVTLTNVFKDRSGNGNDWTGVNIDVTTPGATLDYLKESFTVRGDIGNYATYNPLWKGSAVTVSDGNLRMSDSGAAGSVFSTIGVKTGKHFVEQTITNVGGGVNCGIVFITTPTGSVGITGGTVGGVGFNGSGGIVLRGVTIQSGLATPTTNDVFGFALDATNNTLQMYRNGATFGSQIDLTSVAQDKPYFFAAYAQAGQVSANAGQQGFAYPIAGFPAWATGQMTKPALAVPSQAFVSATGLGSAIEASLAALRAGWGADPYYEEFKDLTNTQAWKVRFSDDPTNMLSWNSNSQKLAFTAPTAGDNYISYATRIGAAYGVTTTQIAHVNGVATNWAHGLGSANKTVWAKMESGVGGDFFYYHPFLTAGSLLSFNLTSGEYVSSSISVDATNVTLASSLPTGTYRIVAKSEVTGCRAFGRVIGNASADGPVAYAGFKPLRFWSKNRDTTGNWYCFDGVRNPTNVGTSMLKLEGTDAASIGTYFDRLATGLKIRNADGSDNGSGNSIVWEMEAEAPLIGGLAV